MSDSTEEIPQATEETTEEIQPTEEAKIVKSRKIRSQKQLEALERAREKAFAKRKEKAELKAQSKAKQKQNEKPAESEPEPAEPEPAEPEELEPVEIIEKREERQQLKRTVTLTQDELHDMISRVALQTNLSKPKSKFKLVDGMYVIR